MLCFTRDKKALVMTKSKSLKKKPAKKTSPTPSTKTKKTPSAKTLVNRMLNHPMGAYRWHKLYDASIVEHIPALYEGGATDVQVAADIGICESTFYQWIKDHPEFGSAVKYGKTISKASMTKQGLDTIYSGKKINDKVWHIMMRNCHGYDKHVESEDERLLREKQERVNQRAQELLNEKTE